MGYVVNPVTGTLVSFKFSLGKNNLIQMGSVPITLPGTDLQTATEIYIPFSAYFIFTSGSVAYDFAAGDHPVIQDTNSGYYWQWFGPLQNYGIGDIAFALHPQRNHSNETFAKGNPDVRVPSAGNLSLTTLTGNDATVGTYEFDLYLTFFKNPI